MEASRHLTAHDSGILKSGTVEETLSNRDYLWGNANEKLVRIVSIIFEFWSQERSQDFRAKSP